MLEELYQPFMEFPPKSIDLLNILILLSTNGYREILKSNPNRDPNTFKQLRSSVILQPTPIEKLFRWVVLL